MTAEILTLLDPGTPDTWPQGILAAADLREQLAAEVSPDLPWHVLSEHIRAEANPAHALAAVHHWRGVVERHRRVSHVGVAMQYACGRCAVKRGQGLGRLRFPCPDLTETADEARAYLGGAS